MATAAVDKRTTDEQSGGFFTPYKQGQGFWTRLGTGLGAGLVILFTIQFMYRQLPVWTQYETTDTVTETELASLEADSEFVVRSVEPISEGSVEVTYTGTYLAADDWELFLVLGLTALALCALSWWLINRPKHADFLIATDGEMKKVNWPTRRELVGSTKVVTAFMFFMAALLFGYDLIFGLVFYLLNVMKIPPFFLAS